MRTTLYLPDDVKRAVELAARRCGVADAEVMRDALRKTLMSEPVRPQGAIFARREPIADRVDELLAEGFGMWNGAPAVALGTGATTRVGVLVRVSTPGALGRRVIE